MAVRFTHLTESRYSTFSRERSHMVYSIQIKQGQLHSHKDIYSIIIIFQCPLLLTYVYKFRKHNSHIKSKKRKKKEVCDWKECFTLSGLKADIV